MNQYPRRGSVSMKRGVSAIWHEMAQIAGADELDARRQEEELWKTFIVSQVDSRRGLAYLELLSKRPAAESGRAPASPRQHPAPPR